MTKSQFNLLCKAHERLAAARDLLKLGHLEAAVSGAYYVMFYVAEAFLERDDLHNSRHSAVIAEFGRIFAKTGRVPSEFHQLRKKAEHDRIEADYGEACKAPAEKAEEYVQTADRFLKLAEDPSKVRTPRRRRSRALPVPINVSQSSHSRKSYTKIDLPIRATGLCALSQPRL